MPINSAVIRNILVVRNDRFGEFILNIPALRALKETFPDARIIAVVDSYVKILAEKVPFIDEIIEWGRQKHSFWQKIRLAGDLRKRRIDLAVMLNPSREFNFITWAAGIPARVGYDRKCGFLLNYKIPDKKHLGLVHEVKSNLELVGLVGAKTDDKSLCLKIEGRSHLAPNEGNLVAVHPWTSDPLKQWPYEYFVELTTRLIRELNVKVAIVGGQEEIDKSRELFKQEKDNLINLTGKTNLLELASFLRMCKLLISGDSGPVHLAACVNTPTLVIFRSAIPGKNAKRWGPWGQGHTVIEKERLRDITVKEVFDKVKERLQR